MSTIALVIVVSISCILGEIFYKKYFDKDKDKRNKRFEEMKRNSASEQLRHEKAVQRHYEEDAEELNKAEDNYYE